MVAEERHETNSKHHSSKEQEYNMNISHRDVATGHSLKLDNTQTW